MPIYEYRCQNCNEKLEVMQRITDDPLVSCPSCGGTLQRLISNTSFILKGTGWYATDYARKGTHQKESKTSGNKTDEKSSSKESNESSSSKKEP